MTFSQEFTCTDCVTNHPLAAYFCFRRNCLVSKLCFNLCSKTHVSQNVSQLRNKNLFTSTHTGKEVKLSHYRPCQALREPKVQLSRISIQWAHEDSKLVNPTHRPSLPNRRGLSRLQDSSAAGRIKSRKNPNYPIRNRTSDLLACSAVHICAYLLTYLLHVAESFLRSHLV